MRRARAGLAAACALALVAGCSSDGIDPPRDEDLIVEETGADIDSLATWAQRAREGWASGDSLAAREANALARAAFAGAWVDRLSASTADARARDAERLPAVSDAGLPTPAAMRDALAAIGLASEIVVAGGPLTLWQVVVRDPTGAADAGTEFWTWPDPAASQGEPVMQPLPANAPRRAKFGPEAIGVLTTYKRPGGVGLVSAWTRPRGTNGIEVAVVERATAAARGAPWRVTSTKLLPIAADSVSIVASRSEIVPSLIIRGPGGRDALFDACPTCPRVSKRQRYAYTEGTWGLREEVAEPSPYAAIVAFMHALRDGGPENALPYASGPEVLEQVRELGLERGPIGILRAAPGTSASDVTQRYRRGGSSSGGDALEITVVPQGERWVVGDLRPTRIVIE